MFNQLYLWWYELLNPPPPLTVILYLHLFIVQPASNMTLLIDIKLNHDMEYLYITISVKLLQGRGGGVELYISLNLAATP